MTTKKKVGFATAYEDTDDLDRGEKKVKTDGKIGRTHHRVQRGLHNGKLESRKQISAKITRARGPRSSARHRERRREKQQREQQQQQQQRRQERDSSDNDSGKSSSNNADSSAYRRRSEGTAFMTGYSYWDNSPPGSAQISRPVLHERAGGTGTYRDPITVAVGTRRRTGLRVRHPVLSAGLDKYFIVEDICGA